MERIPGSFIEELLSRIDIVDVIEQHLMIKKSGQNYIACCPFHKEKSPSFTISSTKQFYHCFGCGAHGNAIDFIINYIGVNFPKAVMQLAQSAGLSVPFSATPTDKSPAQLEHIAQLFAIMQKTMVFYCEALKKSPEAIAYLKRRGVSAQTAARFKLGFAPSGKNYWQALKTLFPDYENNQTLVESSLVRVNNEKKTRYDHFRERIIFPLFNRANQVVAFGGRAIKEGVQPKYLNSAEMPLFQKGKELYGLSQALNAIRSAGLALVVEGYMDVIVLAQYGIEYTVATLGTACTTKQIEKLLRLTDEIVFCFDGDTAGRKAAWRALENSLTLLQDGKKLAFLFLPPEHDPDSYIRTFGKIKFEALISSKACPLGSFLLQTLSNKTALDQSEGRAKLIHLIKPYINQIRAPALSLMIKKQLAMLCQLELFEITNLLGGTPTNKRAKTQFMAKSKQATTPTLVDIEQKLLRLLLFEPKLTLENMAINVLSTKEGNNNEKILHKILDFIQIRPHIREKAELIEAIRDQLLPALQLEEEIKVANMLFCAFSAQELKIEWADTVKKFVQSQEMPTKLNRKAALEYKAATGGLTEEEKREYLLLLQRN